jgi:hypothetical protein
MRGDKTCPAGPNGVWDGAPQVWKDRVKKGLNKGGRKVTGKGKGQAQQRNQGKRDDGKGGAKGKEPCHNWSRGNGFCKYAEACRFSHDGPQGGQDKSRAPAAKRSGDAVFLATKKGKKARKQLTSLLLKDLKEGGKEKSKAKGNDSEDEDHLYQLIRGVPTVIVKGDNTSFDDFVPVRESNIRDTDVTTVRRGGKKDDTVFTVTLMMTNQKRGKDDDFVPSRRNVPSRGNIENETDEVKIENTVKSETNVNNGRVISQNETNQNVKSELSDDKPDNLGSSCEISAVEWKRRAERAERLVIELVDEKYRQEGVRGFQRGGQRPRLKDDLDFLTNNSPPLDKEVDIEYMVIRRLNKGKDWVCVDVVDGDMEDDYEWCEGPFHQQTTIRELFGRKHRYDRHIRRRISGRLKVPKG